MSSGDPFLQVSPLSQRDALQRRFEQAWLGLADQGRHSPASDLRLELAAQRHAAELCYRERILHEPHGYPMHIGLDGSTPNDRVSRAGYPLPDFYGGSGNFVESVAVDWRGPESALALLANSESHRDHIKGVGFFAEQTRYGIGVACDAWYVLVTAHPPEGE